MQNRLLRIITGLITATAIFFLVYILHTSLVGAVALPVREQDYAAESWPPVPSDIDSSAVVATASAASSSNNSEVTYDPTLPDRLLIPSIGVDAHVQHVGLTATKNMGIPSNFIDVAWYKYGTVPGKKGSAVIDGHVDNALSLPGVFKDLDKAAKGDDVYVVDKNGTKLHFVIRDVQVYNYMDTPTQEIFHESNRTLLRLITCGGTWIKSQKTYDERVVVTAELVD